MMQTNDDPEAHERILRVVAGSMAIPGANNTQIGNGPVLVALNPIHAGVLADAGLTREDVCDQLAKRAVTPTRSCEAGRPSARSPKATDICPPSET